jgi:hypothetical protein
MAWNSTNVVHFLSFRRNFNFDFKKNYGADFGLLRFIFIKNWALILDLVFFNVKVDSNFNLKINNQEDFLIFRVG